jgi:hypothetical protein
MNLICIPERASPYGMVSYSPKYSIRKLAKSVSVRGRGDSEVSVTPLIQNCNLKLKIQELCKKFIERSKVPVLQKTI